jgi:hypothetical protein
VSARLMQGTIAVARIFSKQMLCKNIRCLSRA